VLINEALILERRSLRNVAERFDVSYQAVNRHKQHIPELLAKASQAEQIAEADSLLDRLEDLQRRTEAVLSSVEGTENYGATLGAIREMRRNLEIIGEVTKELNRQPTLNLVANPEWLEIRAVIVGALEPHPGAQDAVLTALEGAGERPGAW
jgi:hypothetical protein